jgi:hypothetical protein
MQKCKVLLEVIIIIPIIIINRMIAEELTEYLIASQTDVQVRQVLDRLWSSLMERQQPVFESMDRTVINNMVHHLTGMTTVAH